ncbi:MAG: hypothetical protein ABIN89_25380 [Chitinophagaceae bacterium]
MKSQLKLMSFVIVATIIIYAGCKKEQSAPVSMNFTYSGQKAPGSFIGTFSATGGIKTSGTNLMTVQTVGEEFNCVYTLTPDDGGSIVLYSHCKMATNTGTWRILNGTGSYSNLGGNGSLIMTYPGAGVVVREVLEGTVFKK